MCITSKCLSSMTKNERSLLLYFETCLVDHYGLVQGSRMNKDDFKIAKQWNEEEFIKFHRTPGRYIIAQCEEGKDLLANTHWIEFTDEAYLLAHQERKNRADRCKDKLNEILDRY